MNSVLRRLISEIGPHKKSLVIIAITGIIVAIANARLALFVGEIQDSFQLGHQDKVGELALFALGLALAISISRYFHIFTMNMVAETVVNRLRIRLQGKFMNLSLGFHSNYEAGSGGLMSRILNDVKVIQDGLRMVADFFREPLAAVLLLGNLFYLNWRLTFIILILLPIILWFLRQVSKSLRKYVLWGQENLERITSTIKESLDGVRTIQSFNLERLMTEKLEGQSEEYLKIRSRVHSRIEIMGPVTEFIATCVVLGIFFYFSAQVGKGSSTSGDIIAYITSMLMINAPLKKLQESYVRIQETVVAATRVYGILDETAEVALPPQPKPFPQNWSKIIYRNVAFAYGSQAVLQGVSLEIHRGQSIAFVGESGSGKTTLVNLLARFHDPTQGEILIDDVPIRDIDLKDLRRHIALVSQDVFLFSDTIEKNILAGSSKDGRQSVEDCARAANAHDFIQRLPEGYQTRVGERGGLLSGGEKQRVSIARAFYKDAPVLILDEATSALDSASEKEVQAGLVGLMKGRTSFLVAHRLSTIQNADRIYVLDKGRVVEQGRHDELLGLGGAYKRFWNLQSHS